MVAVGHEHACAIVDGGKVKCWGYRIDGQLGDGSGLYGSGPIDVEILDGPESYSSVPVDATLLDESVTAIFGGSWTTCAVTESGRVQCWGETDGVFDVTEAYGLEEAAFVSINDFQGCVVSIFGSLTCGTTANFAEPPESLPIKEQPVDRKSVV